ncbi:MAG: alpha/beta fold hydrolase, partial [Cyanobacteria bacterium J06636_16]
FFTPNNPLELQLTQIWESVLGVRPLSVEASFFAMGGDSLLAVQLFNQMQQQLNCTLPLATLFQAPNVRQFAALLSQDEPVSQWSSLVPIQTNGARPPLFFHGGSADALTWAEFSHRLGPDQPFYALQRPDLDGSDVTHTTVEALATACITEMRMVQPQGPYLVGGHCFGGAVAFEIAQQLQAQGEAIISLVLIDAYCPESLSDTRLVRLQTRLQLGVFWLRKNYYYHGGWEKLSLLPSKIWQRLRPSAKSTVRAYQDDGNGQPAKDPAKDIETTAMPSASRTASDYAQKEVAASISTVSPVVPYEYRYARAQDANETAAAHYLPQPYSGRIKLFRADIQTLEWYFGPVLGWQSAAKDTVEVTKIPGFFGNLFNHQSGPLLAQQVKAYLATIA